MVGQLKEGITHCLYNPYPDKGFEKAMQIPKKQFGNPYTIAQAWIEKVFAYKSRTTIYYSFADMLSSCRDTLKTMNCEGELNGGRSLLQIAKILLDDMKRKCLSLKYEITTTGRDGVRFVHMEAEKRTDPIFGDILKRNPGENHQGKGSTKQKKAKFCFFRFLDQAKPG